MQAQEFPFRILALAPFTPDRDAVWDRPPIAVDRQSLDEAMAAVAGDHYLSLDGDLCAAGGLTFRFDCLKSLHPDGIADRHPFFTALKEAADYIEASQREGLSSAEIARGLRRWPDLPAMRIEAVPPPRQASTGTSTVDRILDLVDMPGAVANAGPTTQEGGDPVVTLRQKVLDRLFDQPEFRQMETAWRGLRLLLQQGISYGTVQVEIVPVHAPSLAATLEALTETLFQRPPGMILLDLPFDASALAMDRLAEAARWAADLMVPLVTWIPASFFRIADWTELDTLPFLPNHVQGAAYAKYQALKASADGRWLCLTCNRFLVRYPYGKDNRPRHIDFEERRPLWIPPVWALGTLAARCADRTGWPTRLTDHHQFSIQDLALHTPGKAPPMVVETLFSRDRSDQLARAGITPLATQRGSDRAFFTRAVTVADTSLAYQLLAGRVTAFLLWCRDNLPEETAPEALQAQLRLAFQVFSEQSRPAGFESIGIDTGPRNAQGKIPLTVALKPAAAVLASQQKIELELNW